MLVLKS